MEITQHEKILLEFLRGARGSKVAFKIEMRWEDYVWDCHMTGLPETPSNGQRGTGKTFSEAWQNMYPLGT